MTALMNCPQCGGVNSAGPVEPGRPRACLHCGAPLPPPPAASSEGSSSRQSSIDPPEVDPFAADPANAFGPAFADGRRRYVRMEAVFEDALGVICRAYDRAGARFVSARLVPAEGDKAEMLQKHAERIARIQQPGVVPILRTGRDDKGVFLILKIPAGETLDRAGIQDARRLCRILQDAAEALHQVHEVGVLHGDLHPGNLIVASEKGKDHVYLKDFGLAYVLEAPAGPAGAEVPAPGKFRAAGFVPPEQRTEGARPLLTVAGDVYALGATLYALLAGRPPEEEPAALAGVPESLAAAVQRALSKSPHARHPDARAFAENMSAVLKGKWETVQAPSAPPPPPPPPEPKAQAAEADPYDLIWTTPETPPAPAAKPPEPPPPPAAPVPKPETVEAKAPEPPPPEPPKKPETAVPPPPAAPAKKPETVLRKPPELPKPLPELPAEPPKRREAVAEKLPELPKPVPAPKLVPAPPAPRRGRKGVAVAAVVVIVLGGGGFVAYQKFGHLLPGRTAAAPVEPARPPEAAPAPKLASIKVESEPSGAEVLVNGKPVGMTPLSLGDLEPGDYTVQARREGFRPSELQVTCRAGGTEKVRLELKPLPGSVKISGLQAGDKVALLAAGKQVRGAEARAAELEMKDVLPGEYQLVVERAGHEPGRAPVTVAADRVVEAAAPRMGEKPGSLSVESTPPDAEIYVDGKASGKTPAVLKDVPPGTRRIKLVHPDRSDWEDQVDVKPGLQAEVKVLLPGGARLIVELHPPDARATGAVAGSGRIEARLKAGEYRVRAEHPEAGSAERAVQLRGGEEVRLVVDLWAERGEALVKEGKLAEADEAYARARPEKRAEASARLADGWASRGAERLKAREWEAARTAADRALRLRPEHPVGRDVFRAASYELAVLAGEEALRAKDWKKARLAAEEALKARPGDARARKVRDGAAVEVAAARGRDLEAAGDWLDARSAYGEVLALRPGDEEAARGLERTGIVDWTQLGFAPGGTLALAASGDGAVVALGGMDKSVRIWDEKEGRVIHTMKGHAGPVLSLAFSADGATLASGGQDKTVRLWRAAEGKAAGELADFRTPVWALAFAPKGDLLAVGTEDGTVRIWKVEGREEVAVLRAHSGVVLALAFHPEGRLLASGGRDAKVRVWEVKGEKELFTLSGHTGYAGHVAFSPDGKTLASAGGDALVRLWDVGAGRELRTLAGHEGYVSQVAFRPDGRVLASGGQDKQVRVWDLSSGRQVCALAGHGGEVLAVSFRVGGRGLVSGGAEGARLWGPK